MRDLTKLNVNIKNHFQYLKLLNGILELTVTERLILGAFLDIYEEFPTKNAFSAENKKEVAKLTGKRDFNTLNVYIKKFKDHKLITKKGDKYVPLDMLLRSKKIVFSIKNE